MNQDPHITLRARPALARAALLLTGRRPAESGVVVRLRQQLAAAQDENRRLRLALDYHRAREVDRETREHTLWQSGPGITVGDVLPPKP